MPSPLRPTIYLPEPGFMLSDAELAKVEQIGSLYNFLRFYAKGDRSFDFDDFTENAAIGDYPYAVANNSGSSIASFAIPATRIRNGAITATTGTDDNANLSLIGHLLYRGADNAGMETRLKVDQVAGGLNVEAGFIDAVPGSNASGVTDVDTPTAAFSNGALLQIDTDQTIQTLAFVSKGSAASQVIHATTLATPAATVLTLATYLTISVQLRQAGTSASIAQALCWVNGILAARHTYDAGAVNAATLLAPWIYIRTRSTTPVIPTVDYLARWSDRNA